LSNIALAPQALWGRPVVIGGGVAGAVTALTLSPMPAVLVDPVPVGREAASRWAQGGLAAAVGADDSPELQATDTVAAGAGLTDADVARRIAAEGPATVEALERFGVRFDRGADGGFALGLEAAHSRRRILHVRDATGSAIVEALGQRLLATPSVEIVTAAATRLLVGDGGITGVVIRQNDEYVLLPTACVVLATGGIGGLWQSTTNPVGARGAGLALAARAGAVLADLEFMQFHPTALAVGADPMPLVSEAVRGEGAILVDAEGRRFMEGTPGGDLAPRDIVARAVFAEWAKGGSAALDVRHFAPGAFATRFPNIHRVLTAFGIDPEVTPIPIRPAAHYHMGGVRAGVTGRTSIDGLWAAGEVACTGLHGANRLASNSLLEAAVCGRLAAEEIAGLTLRSTSPQADEPAARTDGTAIFAALREIMNRDVGVVRDGPGLVRAIEQLNTLGQQALGTVAEDTVSVTALIAGAALRRAESRGAHFRSDAGPQREPARRSESCWDKSATPTSEPGVRAPPV
jgi:L-aspartate oxidase